MTDPSAQYLIEELDVLLDQERLALIEGNLELLGRILSQKQGLIDRINELDARGKTRLSDIHRKVMRNQELLIGAMDGIRAVSARMADLRRVRQGLETYDQTGCRKRIETGNKAGVEKRA